MMRSTSYVRQLLISLSGAILFLSAACAPAGESGQAGLEIAVSFDPEVVAGPVDGRIILIFAVDNGQEPRFQVSSEYDAPQIFGVTVSGLTPGGEAVIDASVFGFPVESLNDVPAGDYWVQAVLHRYENFTLANGKTVLLPPDQGEGQHWNRAPGSLYSTPQKIHIDPAAGGRIQIKLGQLIPAITPPEDTKYIKHIRIKSELLSEFWGRPMYLGANILLPEGFDEHPEAHYPLIINHGHFSSDFWGFRTEPPDPDAPCEPSKRFRLDCYNRVVDAESYDFYKRWTGPDFPRWIIVDVQHANPYYDDSYAVNSANLGPYGDAINHELIPYIEKEFQGIGQGWARFLYGGSTGGWEAMAVQVFYPDDFNGAFIACPDPIDFRAYTQVNIYDDNNAYYLKGPFGRVVRPGHRDWLGEINRTMADDNHYELVLGDKSRSGEQYDIWEAVYSPMGEDGYPERIWDKKTGAINHEVADYWRENYDLTHIMKRDWKTLGPKLVGKLHIYVGEMDNYYLNNAVYLAEEFLESTTDPYYAGEVDYGARDEHCWNGDHQNPNAVSRLRYHTMYVDKILARMAATAPEGADLTSWRY